MPVIAVMAIVGPLLFVAFLWFRLRTNGSIEFTAKPRLAPLVEGKVEAFIELRLDEARDDTSTPPNA